MKRTIVLVSFCLLSFVAFSAVRTKDEAAVLAAQCLNDITYAGSHKSPAMATSMQLAYQCLKLQNDEPAFYVFNKADDGGFVIVSGDDRTVDILGYSNQGSFDYETVNPNLQFWLNMLQEAVSATNDSNVSHKAPQSVTEIDPLLTNKAGKEITWSQDAPYYNLCPKDSYGRCVTGCVATAAAMVMYKWCYPEMGIGQHSYRWNGQTLSADYENTTYDWENMLPAYWGKSATSAQKTAVATLMYHAGVACEMQYSSQGSGAYTDDMANGLVNYFGYHVDKFITTYGSWYDASFSPAEYRVSMAKFKEYFNAELEEGRPIIMGGADQNEGGHEFVCDGRDANGNFHINWGWEGDGNAYFSLDALKVDGYNFSSNLDAIIGLRPGKVDTIHVTSVAVNPSSATLRINEKVSLIPTIQPSNATVKKVLWSSSDLNIAKVTSEGIVRGIGPGQAIITAITKDGHLEATCAITVKDEFVPSDVFELVTDEGSLQEGDDIIIEADYNNAHYCATTTMSGFSKTTYTNCEQVQIVDDAISLSERSHVAVFKLGKQDGAWTLTNADGQKLSAVAEKKLNLDQGVVTWILNVTDENATIASTNEAYGCIMYNNNNSDPRFCIYNSSSTSAMVMPNIYARYNSKPVQAVHVTGVELGQTSAQLVEGEEMYLYYAVKPVAATNQSVIWSSSNPEVVTVDPNQTSIEDDKTVTLKGLSEGEATITVKTLDGGFVATCQVKVTKEVIIPKDTTYVTASEARGIGTTLLPGSQTTKFYGVKGYVTAQNTTEYQGFWLDDAKTENQTFQGFQCTMPVGHLYLNVGEYVCVYGYIMNYNNEKMQIKDGTVVVLEEPSSLDPISQTPNTGNQTQKLIRNGQIIFIRGEVRYNALGVRIE